MMFNPTVTISITMERDYVSAALRTACDLNVGEDEWVSFAEKLKKKYK